MFLYLDKEENLKSTFFVGNWNALYKKNTSVRMDDLDSLPYFSLHEIVKNTHNFSINNKIGEGGFGPVYKVIYSY